MAPPGTEGPLPRHVFLADLVEELKTVREEAGQRGLVVLDAVGQEDLPALGLAVPLLDEVLDQTERLGGGVLYLLADDPFGIDDPGELVESMREAMPVATTPDEEDGVERMAASLDRMERLYESLGAAAFRLGYLRDGILHHVTVEDDEAAPAMAISELMMQDLPPEGLEESDPSDFGIDPDLTRR